MKLYLDTNLVSAFVLEDQPGERTAIAAVLSRGNSGALSLVTSALVAKELEPYRGDKRPEIVLLNEQFAKVPYVEAEAHVGYDSAWHDDFGAWSNPLYHVEPDWSAAAPIWA